MHRRRHRLPLSGGAPSSNQNPAPTQPGANERKAATEKREGQTHNQDTMLPGVETFNIGDIPADLAMRHVADQIKAKGSGRRAIRGE